jgi:hypothetical protein
VKSRRRQTSLDTKRLLERDILCGTRCEPIGFEARTVQDVEKTGREIVVRYRRGTIPNGTRSLRLREGTREAGGMSRGEIVDRIEGKIAECVGNAVLIEAVGSSPEQSLEAMAATVRIPSRFVRSFCGPPAVVSCEVRTSAEGQARYVVCKVVPG